MPAASSTTSSSTTIRDQCGTSSRRPVPDARYGVHAARAQGRLGFGRRARRAQPRLPQYRPVQRGMAAALQPVGRRQADHARSRLPTRSKNSVYWQATEQQTVGHGAVLPEGRAARPAGRRAGRQGASAQPSLLDRGKIVFAENCARCHSSKQPAQSLRARARPARTAEIIENTGAYFDWMRAEVQKPDFLAGNYLSTDRRVSIQEMRHQRLLARWRPTPSATTSGTISRPDTYKELPSIGPITIYNPIDRPRRRSTRCRAAGAAMCGRPR